MSFGLSRGKKLDGGHHFIAGNDLPPLPDEIATDPTAGWIDVRTWFAQPEQPLHIEIGSGKGTFLVQTAPPQTGVNFLGIEWAGEFARYAGDRIRRHQLEHVRILNTDASEFIHWRVPTGIAHVVHLYFPDPWPKKRHHTRRMIQDRFLADCHRILIPNGELRVVTDHADYWTWMEEHFNRWTTPVEGFGDTPPFAREPFERPDSAGEGEVVGTNFERKYRREGRPFHATVLRRSR